MLTLRTVWIDAGSSLNLELGTVRNLRTVLSDAHLARIPPLQTVRSELGMSMESNLVLCPPHYLYAAVKVMHRPKSAPLRLQSGFVNFRS